MSDIRKAIREGKRMFENKCKLVDLQLHKDEDCGYYMSAVYRHEDESGIYETTIPHICLFTRNGGPIVKRPIRHRKESLNIDTDMPTIDLGFGDLIFIRVNDKETGCCTDMITKTIEKKVKKMTLADIEKKLGYKIELVSGEE